MIYDIDNCEECGAARVSGSRLCVGCLVKERGLLEKEVLIKMAMIEGRSKRIKILEALLKEATAYGFNKNRENQRLLSHIKGLNRKIREVMEDGKDRVDGNI